MFVDYAGHTVAVVNRDTGELREAQIFVAVLGASNYTYAEATWTQTLPDWIASHVRAFEFMGGTTELLFVDYVPRHIIDEQPHGEPPAGDGLLEHGQERGGVLRVGEGGEGDDPGGVVDEREEEGPSAPAPVADLRSVHDIAHPIWEPHRYGNLTCRMA